MLHCFAFFAAFALFKIICVRAWICWNSCAAFSPSEINPSNTFCRSDSLFSSTEVLTSCARGLPWIGDIIVSVKKMLSGFSRSIVYVTCEKQGAVIRVKSKIFSNFISIFRFRFGCGLFCRLYAFGLRGRLHHTTRPVQFEENQLISNFVLLRFKDIYNIVNLKKPSV